MRAISSMATKAVLAELCDAAAGAELPIVELESVGGVDAARRVAAGEPVDLVFLAEDALRDLAARGHVDAATVTPLLLSRVAVAVPEDSAARAQGARSRIGPAFPDAHGLRAALRSARRIGYSTGPSGRALVELIEEWGLGEELGDRLVQARPGVPVARLVAERDVDLGIQQLSELVGHAGVRVLGILPSDCAIDTVFGGAVAASTADAAQAARVLRFFRSAAAAGTIAAHSFEPAPASPSADVGT